MKRISDVKNNAFRGALNYLEMFLKKIKDWLFVPYLTWNNVRKIVKNVKKYTQGITGTVKALNMYNLCLDMYTFNTNIYI